MYHMGVTDYTQALEMQACLVTARLADEIPDVLLFLQHPPMLTIGTSGSDENIIVSTNMLTSEEIHVFYEDLTRFCVTCHPSIRISSGIFLL